MNSVNIKGVSIGEGQPKICVPIMGRNHIEIVNQAEMIKNLPFDIVEWRADYFEEITDMFAVKNVLADISRILFNKPILFTFRTSLEGGQKWIPSDQYRDVIFNAVASGLVDITDIELFLGDRFVEHMINEVHKLGANVIVSNHDFDKTPSKEVIVERMKNMEYLGADIAKIAVMPKNKRDVIELLDATLDIEKKLRIPLVTMSMGRDGILSRISGEFFNSAITFGAGVSASAPGQISANDLYDIVSIIHKNLEVY